ncbi:MAG: O-antigen ligase family protein [Acidobacteriota bacterium]
MLLPLHYFFLMMIAGVALVLFFPLWWVVIFDLSLVTLFGNWSIGFLRIGPNDLPLLFLAAALLLRGRRQGGGGQTLPFLVPWLVLTACFCLSYYLAPVNQRNLDAPLRIVYQLLRYGVRPVIYLPIILLLIRSPKRAYILQYTIVLAAVQCSLMAIQQGYAGYEAASGPFRTGNQLGGVLVMPMMMATAGSLLPRNRTHWIFSAVSLLLMARAMLFCGSRGAMVALTAGLLFFFATLLTAHVGRRRLRYLSPLILMGFVASLPLIPFILSRPTIQHALTAADGSKASTMQWRMQERWPHFWNLAVENPWFGLGSAVDTSLGRTANTPHNGFLSILVIYGFPAFLLILFFAFRAMWNGLRLYWHADHPDHKLYGITSTAALGGILAHQMVEVTITAPFTFKVFWILVATTELARRWYNDDEEADVGSRNRAGPGEDPLWEPLPSVFEPIPATPSPQPARPAAQGAGGMG